MNIYHTFKAIMNNIKECQEALFTWMSLQNQVNYNTIKKYCEYLNLQYNLLIEEHPAWKIFLPLFFAGNIDFCGDNCFKVTEPIAVTKRDFCIYTNTFNQSLDVSTAFHFIFRSKEVPHIDFKKIYRFNAVSILKHFPTVKDIVSKFEPLPLNDFSSLKFDNREIKFGVAQKEDWNLKYYFVYPETRRVVAVPYWNVNPDGINVAYCYSRSIDGRGNGKYSLKDKRMYITSYRFPILLYRILLLESLLEGNTPFFEQGLYIFPNINLNIANQINRILNNSIQYE